MTGTKKIPLRIYVEPTTAERQFTIKSNFRDADGEWNDNYVDFSGYFGKFSPHTFAAAPDLNEALIAADGLLRDLGHSLPQVKAALAKARGAA